MPTAVTTLQSFIAGRWIGNQAAGELKSAINGRTVFHAHAEKIDFAEALAYARGTGLQSLLSVDFQQRAALLKALGAYLLERKELLYAISHHTGATRTDSECVALLARGNEIVFGEKNGFTPMGEGIAEGAFFAPTLLLCRDGSVNSAVHDVEAFGPVSTLMPYDDIEQAIDLCSLGRGSLVSTLVTRDPAVAAKVVPAIAAWHGRVHILDREAAAESTGHGSPLPMLKHGGPGRAGGGEELGGVRAVKHYLQRAAVQGSPTMLTAVTGEYVRGAKVQEGVQHPFRKWFDDLAIGDSLLTHRRTVTDADIVAFGGISGDYFYMHFDEIAAKESPFGKRIAHGYFVLSAAAGLFVSPAKGPVLANYGLDTLRFVKPVGIGDTIQARLTCKRKIDRPSRRDQPPQGVVAWDVQVTNQDGELVASYDILTLVLKRPAQ